MKKMNNIKQYKNPYVNQYTAPYGYSFYDAEGNRLGRIIWVKNPEGIYVDKDLFF